MEASQDILHSAQYRGFRVLGTVDKERAKDKVINVAIRRRKIHRIRKPTLVYGYIPKSPSAFLNISIFEREMEKMLKGKAGIYVLYKRNKPYYVGQASKNLFGRIRWHFKDRHKGKWDSFSVYIIRRVKYLDDIEALLHRTVATKGNVVATRFSRHYAYQDRIRKVISEVKKAGKQIEKAF